tara:strand:+ start:4618 stop:6261 length:1644 start_codon:yes stop_codon:yes gene_type:complete
MYQLLICIIVVWLGLSSLTAQVCNGLSVISNYSFGFPLPTEQDCLGAIPVCQNLYVQNMSFSGEGNFPNEINSSTSCLTTGEKNDVWYIFTIQQSGNLCFSITPNNVTEDYDWAVFDLTNNSCEDIYSTPSMEVSCNYDYNPGITGANGLLGAQNEPCIPVLTGETYVLNVSNFSASQNGYTLDFSSSTAQVFDNVPPIIDSVAFCGGDSIEVHFSEYIDCQSVDYTDFRFYYGTSLVNLNSVLGKSCALGARFDNPIILVLPQQYFSGDFSVVLADDVYDQCGNIAVYDSISFTYSRNFGLDLALGCEMQASSFEDTTDNQNTWVWNMGDGNTYNSSSFEHIYNSPGSYLVSLSFEDKNGCSMDSLFYIYISDKGDADFSYSPSIIVYNEIADFIDQSVGANQWFWDFGDGNNSGTQNPTHIYPNVGFYDVQLIINADSICPDTIIQKIEVVGDFICEVPQAFTPNNDNVNDRLTTLVAGVLEMEFIIYNRWGNVVYYTDEIGHAGWDGIYNGNEQEQGIYYYCLSGFNNRTKQYFYKKGDITLIR